jgi:hypothetical protein
MASYSAARTRGRPIDTDADRRARLFATIVGAAFVIVGIAGFVPGITTHVGDMKFAGHDSPSELFGVFQVSVLHNLVHLAFGVIGLAAARWATTARTYLIVGGLVYLALVVFGVLTDNMDDANFVPVNTADDWLHLALGAGMILLGALTARRELPRDVSDARGGVR